MNTSASGWGSRENLEYDHTIPVAKGGSNAARNIELLAKRATIQKVTLFNDAEALHSCENQIPRYEPLQTIPSFLKMIKRVPFVSVLS